MSRIDKPRASSPESPKDPQTPEPGTPLRNPRALIRPDWFALILLAIVIVSAPLWAGSFANLSGNYPMGSAFQFLGTGGMPLALGLVALAAAVTALREWTRPVAIGAVPGLAGACVLMGGWATISLVRSFTLAYSLNALAVLFCILMLGGLVSRLSRDRNAMFALLGAVLIGGTLVATFGLREYIEAAKTHDLAHRTFSSFANPDFLAGYLLLVLPITLAAFVTARERMVRLLLGLGLVSQSACLLLTGSRSGVAMLLVALAVWLASVAYTGALRRQSRAVAMGLAVFALGAFLGFAPTLARFKGNVEVKDRQTGQVTQKNVAEAQGNSGAFRQYTWDGTVHMALANPLLGTGIGTYEAAYPKYAETAFTLHAHNGYLQWMAETGIPSGFFLLAALAAATAFGTHTLRLQRDRTAEDIAEESSDNALFGDRSVLLAGLLAGVLAALLHNLFDSDFYLVGTAINFAAVIGLLVGLSRDLAPLGTQRPRPLGRELLGFTLLLAVFLLWRSSASLNVRTPYRDGRGGDDARNGGNRGSRLSCGVRRRSVGRRSAALSGLRGSVYASPRRRALLPPEGGPSGSNREGSLPFGAALYEYRRHCPCDPSVERRPATRPTQPPAPSPLGQSVPESERDRSRCRRLSSDDRAGDDAVWKGARDAGVGRDRVRLRARRAGRHCRRCRSLERAVTEYAAADKVMAEYWEKRKLDVNLNRTDEKRADLARLYDAIFTRWQEALTQLKQPVQAAEIAARQTKFRAERDADKAEAERAAAAAPTP